MKTEHASDCLSESHQYMINASTKPHCVSVQRKCMSDLPCKRRFKEDEILFFSFASYNNNSNIFECAALVLIFTVFKRLSGVLVHFKLIHLVLSAFLENTAKSNGSAQFLQSAVDLH